MLVLKKILLTNVNSYIQDQLANGGEFSILLKDLEFFKGSVYSFLPGDVSLVVPFDYEESFEFTTGIRIYHQADDQIVNIMNNYLKTRKDNLIVLETFWEKTDGHLLKSTLPRFTVDARVYLFLQGRNSENVILDCLYQATSYPKVVLFFRDTEQIENLSSQDMSIFGKTNMNIDCIMIGAYDDEGYVFWIPEGNKFIEEYIL